MQGHLPRLGVFHMPHMAWLLNRPPLQQNRDYIALEGWL